ncbi:hypothetical protein BKA70DRAFT_382160 [Coprinopsis sp. MPI-PUGE-AT-0042]|nr:hypothetical protein BKA70DRAFT_382160 [Coprinopsis sp. MPI-PUGE-AT-0042]
MPRSPSIRGRGMRWSKRRTPQFFVSTSFPQVYSAMLAEGLAFGNRTHVDLRNHTHTPASGLGGPPLDQVLPPIPLSFIRFRSRRRRRRQSFLIRRSSCFYSQCFAEKPRSHSLRHRASRRPRCISRLSFPPPSSPSPFLHPSSTPLGPGSLTDW